MKKTKGHLECLEKLTFFGGIALSGSRTRFASRGPTQRSTGRAQTTRSRPMSNVSFLNALSVELVYEV